MHIVAAGPRGHITAISGGTQLDARPFDEKRIMAILTQIRKMPQCDDVSVENLREMSYGGGGFIEYSLISDGKSDIIKKKIGITGLATGKCRELFAAVFDGIEEGVKNTPLEGDWAVIMSFAGYGPAVRVSSNKKSAKVLLLSEAAPLLEMMIREDEGGRLREIDLSVAVTSHTPESQIRKLVALINKTSIQVMAPEPLKQVLTDRGVPRERISIVPSLLNPITLDPLLYLKNEPTSQP